MGPVSKSLSVYYKGYKGVAEVRGGGEVVGAGGLREDERAD